MLVKASNNGSSIFASMAIWLDFISYTSHRLQLPSVGH